MDTTSERTSRVEMILLPLFGLGSPWGPPRMMAAMVLGKDVLEPMTFDLGVVAVAMMIHAALSVAYAIVLALIVNRLSTGNAVLAGAGLGLALYLVNFYIFTPVLFPWFSMGRNGVNIFAHLVFGAVAGWAYKGLQHRGRRKAPAPIGGPTVPRPA